MTLVLRVRHTLDRDLVTDVLCRAITAGRMAEFGSDDGDVDDVDVSRLSRTKALDLLRGELAFGGYEAYGHMWDENVEGDTDDFYDRIHERVCALFPEVECK